VFGQVGKHYTALGSRTWQRNLRAQRVGCLRPRYSLSPLVSNLTKLDHKAIVYKLIICRLLSKLTIWFVRFRSLTTFNRPDTIIIPPPVFSFSKTVSPHFPTLGVKSVKSKNSGSGIRWNMHQPQRLWSFCCTSSNIGICEFHYFHFQFVIGANGYYRYFPPPRLQVNKRTA